MDPFTLDELRGYGILLAFVAPDCDSACPYVLQQFTRVKATLGEYALQVRFVVIGTKDVPEWPSSLLRSVRSHDPDFMVLTADAQTLVSFAYKHGVTMLRMNSRHGSVLVPLIPYIIYLNPQGLWTMCFPLGMPAEEIAEMRSSTCSPFENSTRRRAAHALILALALASVLAGLGVVWSVHPAAASAGAWEWHLPPSVPPPRVPEWNPMTPEKFELGRYLFYDVRLSGNGTQSCATCHQQSLAFTDGLPTSVGSTGDVHPRNAQSLANAAWNSTLTWANPLLTEIEKQILIPMFGEFPVELGITGKEPDVLNRFRSDPHYRRMFAAAFPSEAEPITWKNIVYALATFVRGFTSFDAPYDRYLAGDPTALSPSAIRGMNMFFSEDLECHHCHTGFNLSASTTFSGAVFIERPFFNTGLYNIDGKGAYPPDNEGVKELTNDPTDMGRFRPPSLRNVALTAPYMHDGSMATLEEVIRFYERGGRKITHGPYAGDGRLSPLKNGLVSGFTLTNAQRRDLITFLESLTDQSFITNPRFSNPFVPAPTIQSTARPRPTAMSAAIAPQLTGLQDIDPGPVPEAIRSSEYYLNFR